MLSLVERVDRTIRRYDLLPPGTRVLVAVSGGADSTALVHVLTELAARGRFVVAGLAHFNHRLRPAGQDDQRFCEELAASLSLPVEVGSADVAAEARRVGTSIEDAGRRLRYGFLEEASRRLEASRIAVGHTRDDQAETVLLALIRGAGPRGLAGMRPRRGAIVRPLLAESHDALLAWLADRGLEHQEDESNRDPRYLRNRVRHELLPLLRERFSTSVAAVLSRESVIAADDADMLDELARQALPGVVIEGRGAGGMAFRVQALLSCPTAIARRVAILGLSQAAGGAGCFFGVGHADQLLRLADGRVGGPLALPGLQAERVGDELRIRQRAGRSAADKEDQSPAVNFYRRALSIPGEASVPGGWVLSSELRQAAPSGVLSPIDSDPRTATVDAAAVRQLSVRFRRPGDRFRPLGLAGRKKLQDFFVDRKVPRGERDTTPLVVDSDDRIVWVAGYAVSEDFRVGSGTLDVVILKLRGESF